MKTLAVKTGRPYQIHIENGILKDCGALIKKCSSAQRVMIISDSNVFPLYGKAVSGSLASCGFTVYTHVFPAGEQSKRLSSIEAMYTDLAGNQFTRGDLIVALGGGVTGDMAGFAAASYLRGIGFVQIPTSLLAQVDSSVGGKTGVDIEEGKNLVGAFWQPSLVLIDPDTLSTLPPRFFSDGMAEVIKYGCIKSLPLFEQLERCDIKNEINDIIYRCVDIKREVVERDEHEAGERMLLNFGHTLGHSLEKLYHYTGLSHGEAVAAGMVMLTRAAEYAGLTKKGTLDRLVPLLKKYGLPVSDPANCKTVAEGAFTDKKSSGDDISIVLLREIGDSFTKKIAKADFYIFCKINEKELSL